MLFTGIISFLKLAARDKEFYETSLLELKEIYH